jgi:hypothetical protein
MRKVIAFLALLAILGTAVPVRAQAELHLASVSVDVWPEYDQPAVLVIYHLNLAPGTSLPTTLTLRIPARAQVNAVAYVDPVNGLLVANYERTLSGDWADLAITTASLQVQVEYYDVLDRTGSQRHVVFDWTGGYVVDQLEVNFLEPVGATDVQITPAPIETAPGQDGLTNHRIQAANLGVGQDYSVVIDYSRSTNDLSIASLPVVAVSTPGPDTPGRIGMTGVLPYLLAGLGFVLILAGVIAFYSWRSGKRNNGSRRKRVRHPTVVETEIYCPQCGKRALAGDAFCRTCGSRLHRED